MLNDRKMEEKRSSIITRKDILILQKLLEDGRASSSSISKEIDLGREIVNYRIKRLIKENLIVKFVPKLNDDILGYNEYIILLKLNLEDELARDRFIKEQIGNKYLVWIIKSNSGWDLLVRLYAESLEEFKNKLSEILENYSTVLANYYTIIGSSEIKETERQAVSRRIFDQEPQADDKGKDFRLLKKTELINLDDKDKQILKLLEVDGRTQYKEIAKVLNISSDTVKYRIDKMLSQGIIENFEPVINFNKLGLFQYAIIVKFSFLSAEEERKAHRFFLEEEQIIKVVKSLGLHEYFLNVVSQENLYVQKFKEYMGKSFEGKIEKCEIFSLD